MVSWRFVWQDDGRVDRVAPLSQSYDEMFSSRPLYSQHGETVSVTSQRST